MRDLGGGRDRLALVAVVFVVDQVQVFSDCRLLVFGDVSEYVYADPLVHFLEQFLRCITDFLILITQTICDPLGEILHIRLLQKLLV